MTPPQRQNDNEAPRKSPTSLRNLRNRTPSLNIGRLAIAFVLAGVLWLTANYESDLEKDVNIPINYLNLPSEFTISNRPYLPDYVKIRIKGTRSKVSSVLQTNTAINIDLADEGTGVSSHKIDPESVSLPRNVQIVRISPREINLDIDTILEKFVLVSLDLGQPAQGYLIDGTPKVIPSTVRIRGPRKIIKEIEKVMTAPIEVQKEKTTFSLDVGLISPDSRVEFAGAKTAKVSVNIIEASVEKTFSNLEVKIEGIGQENFVLKDKTADIKFYGPRSLIKSLHSDDIKIFATVVSGGNIQTSGEQTVSLESKYPHGDKIRLVEIKPAKTRILTKEAAE